MKKALTTTYATAITIIGLIGLLFLATLVPIPGNVKIKVVKSGSMEPTVHVGSIVALRPAASYQVGDIITFGKDTKTQIPTTHRIVKAQGEGASTLFTTKGDANDTEDPSPTSVSDVEGKVFLTVPYAGFALAFARTKLGFFLLVGLPALAVFIEEGLAIYREARRIKLRRMRRARMPQQIAVEAKQEPGRQPAKRRLISTLAVIGVAACAVSGVAYGNTGAFYVNSATSHGNTMKAGLFDVMPALQTLVFDVVVSDPEVILDASTTPEENPPADIQQPQDPSPDISVEISTSDAVLQ